MMDFKQIKNKILTDDKIATAFEYMMSKMVFENPVKPLKFIYKKCKIATERNNLYSIYDKKTGIKLYSKIHFQEVAKYIVDNLDNHGKINHILFLEEELFRYKDKIDFMKGFYKRKHNNLVAIKLTPIFESYNVIRNSILTLLRENNLYQ